jgi:hypothetical protein
MGLHTMGIDDTFGLNIAHHPTKKTTNKSLGQTFSATGDLVSLVMQRLFTLSVRSTGGELTKLARIRE